MKKLLVPIVLASSLVSTTATASKVQVVHSDDKPRKCEMLVKGKVEGMCSSFKLRKSGDQYVFIFPVVTDQQKEFPIAFFTILGGVKGDTTLFPTALVHYGGKFHELKDIGACTTSKQYEYIRCSASSVELVYSRY